MRDLTSLLTHGAELTDMVTLCYTNLLTHVVGNLAHPHPFLYVCVAFDVQSLPCLTRDCARILLTLTPLAVCCLGPMWARSPRRGSPAS